MKIFRLSSRLPTNSLAECMNRKLKTEFCAFQMLLSISKFLNFEYFSLSLLILLHKIPKRNLGSRTLCISNPKLASSFHSIWKEILRKEFCVIQILFSAAATASSCPTLTVITTPYQAHFLSVYYRSLSQRKTTLQGTICSKCSRKPTPVNTTTA